MFCRRARGTILLATYIRQPTHLPFSSFVVAIEKWHGTFLILYRMAHHVATILPPTSYFWCRETSSVYLAERQYHDLRPFLAAGRRKDRAGGVGPAGRAQGQPPEEGRDSTLPLPLSRPDVGPSFTTMGR